MPVSDASVIEVSDELMMRQVHPNLIHEGRLWSGAFTPTQKDSGLLSADRSSIITPRDAYERYLKTKLLNQAGGTWAVSVSEFKSIDLLCYSDPVQDNTAHALVDYSSKEPNVRKILGKAAYAKASARGRLHP